MNDGPDQYCRLLSGSGIIGWRRGVKKAIFHLTFIGNCHQPGSEQGFDP